MAITRTFLQSLDWLSHSVPLSWTGAPEIAGEQLDPFLHYLLRLRRLKGDRGLGQSSVIDARAALKANLEMFRAGFPVGRIEALTIPSSGGGLQCRRYLPEHRASDGAMLYFHGGGFVLGDLDTSDDVCRLICRTAGMQVISVDYRLAPEHPFPAAYEDAKEATRWLIANAPAFNVNPALLVLGGDSAGANLAAVTAVECASSSIPLAGQLLLCPSTDFLSDRASRQRYSEGLFLSESDRRWFYQHYLHGADPCDPRISPLRARNFRGTCPAIVVVAALDVLRDEGIDYAAALAADGVAVKCIKASGLGHGFPNLAGAHRRSRQHVEEAARLVGQLVAAATTDKQ